MVSQHMWDSFQGWDGHRLRSVAAGLAASGEPWVSFFSPEEIETLMRAHGYDNIEHFDHDTLRSLYMGGYGSGPPGPWPWIRIVRATVTGLLR
jgi:hypothetical protein